MTQILWEKEKNENIKIKSQKRVKGGPDKADFFHTAKIGNFKKKGSE